MSLFHPRLTPSSLSRWLVLQKISPRVTQPVGLSWSWPSAGMLLAFHGLLPLMVEFCVAFKKTTRVGINLVVRARWTWGVINMVIFCSGILGKWGWIFGCHSRNKHLINYNYSKLNIWTSTSNVHASFKLSQLFAQRFPTCPQWNQFIPHSQRYLVGFQNSDNISEADFGIPHKRLTFPFC